ncbi:MAG TPA: hypothetical protein VK893_14860 [Pyrinomonadaceae bacterium]|nr:hypothetical protein [Pyrinomonadaceae bacterium]
MFTRVHQPSVLVTVCAFICCVAAVTQGQTSFAEFQKALNSQQPGGFSETDFAALQRGESVVKRAPVQDKREVAVAGLVTLRATAEEFLRSYRESLTKTSNAAVMEAGSFGAVPALADLQNLTLETRDIDDLKECTVGNCQIKLSAAMIERFAREVNWQAPDYAQQATQLFRTMLFEYVTDYRARGDAALITYGDKSNEVRLVEAHEALTKASGYLNDIVGSSSELQPVEELLIWSKIKFGLKPVIAINHITIYKRERELGPQVVAVSKQIYANHYFNSSLALTAFVTLAGPTSYLVYENRSLADGLAGPFSKFKRGVVEKKAVEGLKGILQHSKLTLEAPLLARESATLSASPAEGWSRRLFGGVRPLLWFLIISALIALTVLRNYDGKAGRTAGVKEIEL